MDLGRGSGLHTECSAFRWLFRPLGHQNDNAAEHIGSCSPFFLALQDQTVDYGISIRYRSSYTYKIERE